jgi:hypothetical protein
VQTTGSDADPGEKQAGARRSGTDVAGYVTKPVSFSEFLEVVNRLDGFWLNVAVYSPTRSGHALARPAMGRTG